MPQIQYAKELILGVDPGLSGALVWLHAEKKTLVEVIQAPLTKSIAGKSILNLRSLALTFHRLAPKTRFAVIEKVHSMPEQGVASTFRFGEAYGQVQGLVASHMIPIYLVSPEIWKSFLNLSRDKKESLALARTMFPVQAGHFSRAKDDGLAEATLLAVYGHLYLDRADIDDEHEAGVA